MTNFDRQKIVYDMLSSVYFDGGYSGVVINKTLTSVEQADKAFVTKLFYGVLEKDVYLSYAISYLSKKNPKPKIALVLKIALYQLYFTEVAPHAVISSSVELCKSIGKQQLSGFVNAVLKKAKTVVFPQKSDKIKYLSVYGSVPEWLAKKLIKQFGFDFACQMLTAKIPEKTHIRHNENFITKDELQAKLSNFTSSDYGFYVDGAELEKLDGKLYTAQSLSSIKAVNEYVKNLDGGSVLDLCAAPGGKSVLIAQSGDFDVTACDIHEHRVELIKKYADRMGVKINAVINDATVLKEEWLRAFNLVVCDMPCSGIGVIHSKPDILLNRKEADIPELVSIQTKILKTAANYVAPNGRLCYSTCTVLYEENERIIERFLGENDHFELENKINIYPHIDNCDGFFVATLRRIK